ncbi:MAG: peptide chain release factor N(5)-glutamine methyltransferase [Sinobacteraceae bacterium]|nr:peptide chain release factor N(5)-glutamine methyltransferase [Nevskiaceae bacterium]MCP5340140.1 peptide chain release factor N(5)-glutamine methyltransferase [Nevskiaceae bacterium]
MTGYRTLNEALAATARTLTALGDAIEPRREAEALAAACLGVGRAGLVTRGDLPLDSSLTALLERWTQRRAAGEPLAYIVGYRDFWTLRLNVTPAVLVPRPETELLVERALALARLRGETAAPPALADLGTGSGAIALALASERPDWRIVATDRSAAALDIAQRNARAHQLQRVEFLLGDWFTPLAGRRFDLLVSNPPYVAADDPALRGDSLRVEPQDALTPGPDALAALVTLIESAPRHLESGGWLLLEHGATQAAPVAERLVARGFSHVRSHADLAGTLRATEGQWLR